MWRRRKVRDSMLGWGKVGKRGLGLEKVGIRISDRGSSEEEVSGFSGGL